jgi:hypothetical protein
MHVSTLMTDEHDVDRHPLVEVRLTAGIEVTEARLPTFLRCSSGC